MFDFGFLKFHSIFYLINLLPEKNVKMKFSGLENLHPLQY